MWSKKYSCSSNPSVQYFRVFPLVLFRSLSYGHNKNKPSY